jgi:hypothetical protein
MWIERRINRIKQKKWLPLLNNKTEDIKHSISEKCINALKEDKPLILVKLSIHIPILVLIYYLK